MLPELHQSFELCYPVNRLHQVNRQSGTRRGGPKDTTDARKVQKAGREKLRRDRLNEQFSVLESVLDPDRPKNDKATILADAIQILQDLTAEVKQLKNEHASLLDESCNLTQEKIELQDEKTKLKAQVEQLQHHFEQHAGALPSWAVMDPAMMMGAPTFSCSMPMQHPRSSVASESLPTPLHGQLLTPFFPFPVPIVTIPMHPLQWAYTICGNRNTDRNNPYLPFALYTPHVSSHVERPSAQYPSSVQSLPDCLLQQQTPQGGPLHSVQTQGTVTDHTNDEPKLFQDPSQTTECQKVAMSRTNDQPHRHIVSSVTVSSQDQLARRSDFPDIMLTNLQLRIPASSQCQSDHSHRTSGDQGHKQDTSKKRKKCMTI